MNTDNTLTQNLQELYALELTAESKYYQVVPSLWGNNIYYSETGWGKVLKVIYAVDTFFFGAKLIITNVENSLRYTQETFALQCKEMQTYVLEYQTLLGSLVEANASFDIEAYEKAQWQLAKWCDSTVPFIRLIKKQPEKIDKLFLRFFNLPASAPQSIFNDVSLYEKMLRYKRIIELVRQIPDFLPPFFILFKLLKQSTLLQEEERLLKDWIEKIDYEEIKILTLHKGLAAFVDHIQECHLSEYMQGQKLSVEDLEFALSQRGLNIFCQKDRQLQKWADSLKEGDELESRGKKYVIDKEMISGKRENQMRVYQLQENSKQLVTIAPNRVLLALKKKAAQELSWGVRSMEWFHVSDDGRFAIIERLKIAISNIHWMSQESLNQNDLRILQPLLNQVIWFIEQKATPKNLDTTYLMYDQENNCLKSTKTVFKDEVTFKKGEEQFNYPLLVEFCKQCANGNLTVYKYLVNETQLCGKHLNFNSYYSYFKEVLQKTLARESIPPAEVAALRGISNTFVIRKAETLQKEIVALHRECIEKILRTHQVPNPDFLPNNVSQHILEEFRKGNYICSLWPLMAEKVITAVIKKMRFSEKIFINTCDL